MASLIQAEIDLPIERVGYWSDSTLALQYIKNEKHRLKVFIANRQSAILDRSTPDQWKHVPGIQNPADMITRGVFDPERLMTSSWFTGPEFLCKDEEFWPDKEIQELSADDDEIRRRSVLVGLGVVVDVKVIDATRFSTWLRLKRVVAWMLRFLSNCRLDQDDRESECLSVGEIEDAEHIVVKDIQASSFSQEIATLSSGQTLPDSKALASLCPFVDNEGVLRVGGRLGNLDISYDMKHPPILERTHHSTKLLIEWTHRRNGHVGTEHVLALLRQSYWIMSARVAITQVVSRCLLCRIKRVRRQFPFMADLPQCRAAIDEPPFSECGVDYFGPIYIKLGRKRLKRWACLFTCLTIRCVGSGEGLRDGLVH